MSPLHGLLDGYVERNIAARVGYAASAERRLMEALLKSGAKLYLRHATYEGVEGYIVRIEYQSLYISIAAIHLGGRDQLRGQLDHED